MERQGVTWRAEARGIPAWPLVSAMVVSWRGDAIPAAGSGYIGPAEAIAIADDDGAFAHVYPVEYAPDLENPDVRAAFDRRLALRLGAPPDAVEQGVIFAYVPERVSWRIFAGWMESGGLRCSKWDTILDVETNDPLLARVRAWKSVLG